MRLIDADELKKNFQDELCKGIACAECSMQVEGFCRVERWIDIAPTIEAVPLEDYRSMEQTVYKLTQALAEAEPVKHGRWLPADKGDCTYICSECGFVRDAYILEEKAYCPRCGADMREVEE